jgi:predicted GNAT superfamily acetyltransferase/predicted GIY-YIG superfamily endonuclease
MSAIDYRVIVDKSELQQIPTLETDVWGMPDLECLPPSLLISTAHIGGLILGAFDGGKLVGVCVGMPASQSGLLWSYMAGVHPAYQSQGIGLALKQLQKQQALTAGYQKIAWTFDPLQARNAYFNIALLGAVGRKYHPDFYGSMDDGLNAGLPSDRLEVVWDIRISKKPGRKRSDDTTILRMEDEQCAGFSQVDPVRDLLIAIPSDINELRATDLAQAMRWRLNLRACLLQSIERGYQVTGVEKLDNQYFYRLQWPPSWYLYVVRCADNTLYTGISNNVPRRIEQHNKGKGAAYTASRRPVVLQGLWEFGGRDSASKAELRLKKLPRHEKETILEGQRDFMGARYLKSF